jgi:hypothetical protein
MGVSYGRVLLGSIPIHTFLAGLPPGLLSLRLRLEDISSILGSIVPPDQEHINMFIIYSKYASFQRNSTEFGLIIISQLYL